MRSIKLYVIDLNSRSHSTRATLTIMTTFPPHTQNHLSCMLLSIGDTGEHSLSACATLKYLSVRIKSYHTYHELEPLG
jgi:hypothetical protein